MKFTVTWRGCKFTGRGTYFEPWKRITTFANEVSKRLFARFPKEEFIDALDIVDPYSRTSLFELSANGKESKLSSYMLKKCKVMEAQFGQLFSDPLQPQFEDFLFEKFNNVKNMNEVEFMRFLINEQYGQSYDDLIR